MTLLNGIDIAQGMFPTTRYQGSKRKLTGAILAHLRGLKYTTALDAFGGSGAVAHALKRIGKRVTYNDVLAFNHQIGLALIENDTVRLDPPETAGIGQRRQGIEYGDFIERTFDDIYFTREENRWLDVAVGNIRAFECKYKRALAWFALFQAAMAKRPYNLFHRKNLYMRTADVRRSFGNKKSWDRSFDLHFAALADEANQAVLDNGGTCRALCGDALTIVGEYDLVYIDPPYVNRRGVGVDYHQFYHFLEGMMFYDRWSSLIDVNSKHRRLRKRDDPWCDAARCGETFSRLFERFADSILVVSYRSDGVPPIEELVERLRAVKRNVEVIDGPTYQYALSTNRRSREVLLIAAD